MSAAQEGLTIQAVSERCGVHPVTLRAWERRYGLVRPARTARGHRRYREQDLARIQAILAWLDRGLPIGQVRQVLERQETAPVEVTGPWAEAMDTALECLQALNVRRLEQLFQRLVGDYPFPRVVSEFCEPLRARLNARPALAGPKALFDSFLREKLSGRLLAASPGRRAEGWLVMAVGDPLPAMLLATVTDRPVWCLEMPVPGHALRAWLEDPRLVGVVWVLGEHPGQRLTARLWPGDPGGLEGRSLCTGPALTERVARPDWLASRPWDCVSVAEELKAVAQARGRQRNDDNNGEPSATGLVS